jgi:hypothetical protein
LRELEINGLLKLVSVALFKKKITLRGEGFDEKIIFGILAPGD